MIYENGIYNSGRFIQRKRIFYDESNGLGCEKVNCLSADKDGSIIAGTDKGLFILKGDKFEGICKKISGKITRIFQSADDRTLVLSGNNIYSISGNRAKLIRSFDSVVVDIAASDRDFWIITEDKIYYTDSEMKNDRLTRWLEGGKGQCLAVSGKNIYVATESNISIIHGKRMEWKSISPRFSDLPAGKIKAMSFDSNGYLWIGYENFVVIYDNMSFWMTPDTVRTLPRNGASRIVTDKVGGRYFASDVGLIYQNKGALKYFCAERWIPDNNVNDISVSDDGSVIYVATDKGISVISSYYTTLAEKAGIFDDMVEKYHIRRGFTAARHIRNRNFYDGEVSISDNDGLWTGCYVAAESFRYATTKSKEALEKARRGLNSMLFLTRITGIDGFTARAVRYPGEEGYGDGNREWALSPDGSCEWKGETSSDEMTGHFFGMSVYYDLCANKKEKEEIKVALCKITDHILRNDFRLIDRDGLPTTWACWDPDLLNYDDRWFAERGINSLEFLMFLKVSYHISGDEKYNELYKKFVEKHHYPLNAMQHKVRDAHICHIDDNLAFLATLALLRIEDNEAIRSIILCGMEDHWQYERIEKQPMFCFIHAAFTGRDSDLLEGIQSLREMPLDLIHYRMENSRRGDIEFDTEQEEWFEEPQIKYPLSYDERNLHRPDAGTFDCDCGGRDSAQDPTIFLLPYWIGRYYGLIDG